MLFNSIEFLIFFPTVVILYFLLPYKNRWMLLLAASSIFYMAFIPKFILVLIFLILVDYYAGLIIERSKGRSRKIMLIISIICNIGILSRGSELSMESNCGYLALAWQVISKKRTRIGVKGRGEPALRALHTILSPCVFYRTPRDA